MVVTMSSGVLVAGVTAAPGEASAATAKPLLSLTGSTAVEATDGLSWILEAGSFQIGSGKGGLNISLVRKEKTGYEVHEWLLTTTSALKFDSTTKTGTLNTGSQASPVAAVNLTFKATSTKMASCTSGSDTLYKGTLRGKLTLVTGLAGGGTVGGTSLRFTMGTPTFAVDLGCNARPTNNCVAVSYFDSGNATGVSAGGVYTTLGGKPLDVINLDRLTKLSAPKKAERGDIAEQLVPPATYNTKTKVYSVTTTTSGLVTGSATLSGGTVNTSTQSCKYAGKTYSMTTTSGGAVRYASPPGDALTGHTVLAGTMTTRSSTKNGFYVVTTVKPG